MLKSGGILGGFVRPMYAFGRPRELRSRGLINDSGVMMVVILEKSLGEMENLDTLILYYTIIISLYEPEFKSKLTKYAP